MNKEELIASAAAKSDQIDADNLIGGITLDLTIKAVQRGPSNEQPLQIVCEETDKFYRPSKTYRRALIGCFGDDPANWIGKRIRLVRNPETTFGGVKVGGLEVSHASIPEPVMLMLSTKRGKKTAVKIDVLPKSPVKTAIVDKSTGEIGKQNPKVRGTITGDPEESNLSGLGIDKPDVPTLRKLLATYEKISIDQEYLETVIGKPMAEFNMSDLAELRELYADKKAEYIAAQQAEWAL